MGRKGAERRLKVWGWSGRDVVSLHDLDFMVAAHSRKELHAATVRLRLPEPERQVEPVAPRPEHEPAVRHPGRVFWRDPEIAFEWQSEDGLAELRASATAYRAHQGRWSVPLHRPDPRQH